MARPWVGVKVEFVSLIRFGEYNSSSAYWPVETCVRLRCSDTLQMPGVPVADQIVYLKMRFAFSGNDFGEWEATELPPTAGTKSEDLVCTPSTSNDAEDSEVTSGGSNLTLSGYVIDVRCGSQKHIFNDASHHNCAVACVKGHGVIGLYVNNTIYELRDSKGNSLSQELLSYLGKVITVKGNVLNASPTPIFEDAGHTAPIDLQGVKVLSISSWNAQ